MPTVDSLLQLPAIPERRRHESPDIIDIDALDANDVVYVSSARPSQRRRVGADGRAVSVTREVIQVTDGEDDDDIQFIGRNPARQPVRVGRHRIFSPPPPPQIDGIPPVPRIPERFVPLRQRPPPGLIIPDEDPFPFEANLRPPSPAGQAPPVAAAPSHHVPSMGFGGALLAGVRRIIGPRSNDQQPERGNGWGVSGSFVMRWDPFDLVSGEEGGALDGLDDIGFLNEEDDSFELGVGRMRNQLERIFRQRDRGSKAEPDYQPEYTHPDRPLPGFTHDFSFSSPSSSSVTEDDTRLASGSGTRLCEVTLVCAACHDPLVVGASDVAEDRAKRKLWGLRCGHLLDGKCMKKLMEPPFTSDTTGSSSGRMAIGPEPSSSSFGRDAAAVDFSSSSVRSRLRPRRGVSGKRLSVRHAEPATRSAGRRGASTFNHRSNRKGKGKVKVPVVEAEHEWKCPVSGCGYVHLSLLMDGRWSMDEKRGAIAVFA